MASIFNVVKVYSEKVLVNVVLVPISNLIPEILNLDPLESLISERVHSLFKFRIVDMFVTWIYLVIFEGNKEFKGRIYICKLALNPISEFNHDLVCPFESLESIIPIYFI